MVELDFDQGILRDKASRTYAKALAGSARALANWAIACCGSKVPRGAMPSIHHHVPLPWLWKSCKTSARGSRLQTSGDGGK